MKLLALDTSTEACSAALLLDGEIRERYALAPQQHGRLILAQVEELLAEAGLKIGQLEVLAFGRGPGSFTGVRIACGVIQGLGFSADLPVVPVSSLAALAEEVSGPRALSAIDARMGEVYWGAFIRGDDGLMHAAGDELVSAPHQVPLPEGGNWEGVGSGWASYGEILKTHLSGQVLQWHGERYPHAAHVARLGWQGFIAGQAVVPEAALPVYLRDRVAKKKSDRF